MPRNGSDIYSIPPGTEGFPDTTIESEKYNNYIHDVETDLNLPRPVSMGGTGATSADGALVSLHAEKAGQQITNFDSDPWMAGSFYSLTGATAQPVAGHAFSGIAHITNANNMVVEAIDLTDPLNTPWMRVKTAGVWSAWIQGVTKQFVEVHAAITCADDPPTGNNASDNALWFESSTGLLYVRYNDGDSVQWCIACPQPDISSYALKNDVDTDLTDVNADIAALDAAKVAKAGDTMTGDLTITNTNANLKLNKTGAALNEGAIINTLNGVNRWKLSLGTGLESGGNTGSNVTLTGYDDTGAAIAPPALLVERSTGLITLRADPTGPLHAATKQYVDAKTPQRMSMAGIKQIDIPVPAGAVAAQITGTLYPLSAVNTVTALIQISVTPGVFLSTVGNYTLDGFQGIVSSTSIVTTSAQSNTLGYILTNVHSNAVVPIIFNATATLKRPNASAAFACDARCNTFAGAVNSHGFYSNYASPAASGSALGILALRFLNAGSENFANESYINVEWF